MTNCNIPGGGQHCWIVTYWHRAAGNYIAMSLYCPTCDTKLNWDGNNSKWAELTAPSHRAEMERVMGIDQDQMEIISGQVCTDNFHMYQTTYAGDPQYAEQFFNSCLCGRKRRKITIRSRQSTAECGASRPRPE